SLARRELLKGIDTTASCEKLVDDSPVEDTLTRCDPLHGIEQLLDATHAFLHQIADALGLLLEELQRLVGLEVLREDEYRSAGVARTDLARCVQPFVCMRGRHSDVDERDIRA